MALIFALCLLAILYVNRVLYVRSLLLLVQIGLYRKALARRKRRLSISENTRRLWVWVSRMFPNIWREVCYFAKPATVLDWSQRRYKDYWTLLVTAGRPSGRPQIPEFLQKFIERATRENPVWGPRRIQGEVYRVYGERLNISTIRKYMPRRDPDPRRVLSWQTFLKLNLPNLAAMDFFTIPRLGRNPLIAFFVIQHQRRKLMMINVTEHPTTEWIIEQLRKAFMGFNHELRFLLSDNDQLYRFIDEFVEKGLGIRQMRTQIASPWQNGIAERFIRTLRSELLDFMLPISETVVQQRLLEYQKYYNEYRTHASLDLDSPEYRETGPPGGKDLRLLRRKEVGGLHSSYHWRAA